MTFDFRSLVQNPRPKGRRLKLKLGPGACGTPQLSAQEQKYGLNWRWRGGRKRPGEGPTSEMRQRRAKRRQ